ncbi:hypothetical protein EDC01DRAFT_746590 [Geopyxis carbonaria]|nr:hypothetical protein EDC01DRAFT_746590 [Geopyxis carbonaria]
MSASGQPALGESGAGQPGPIQVDQSSKPPPSLQTASSLEPKSTSPISDASISAALEVPLPPSPSPSPPPQSRDAVSTPGPKTRVVSARGQATSTLGGESAGLLHSRPTPPSRLTPSRRASSNNSATDVSPPFHHLGRVTSPTPARTFTLPPIRSRQKQEPPTDDNKSSSEEALDDDEYDEARAYNKMDQTARDRRNAFEGASQLFDSTFKKFDPNDLGTLLGKDIRNFIRELEANVPGGTPGCIISDDRFVEIDKMVVAGNLDMDRNTIGELYQALSGGETLLEKIDAISAASLAREESRAGQLDDTDTEGLDLPSTAPEVQSTPMARGRSGNYQPPFVSEPIPPPQFNLTGGGQREDNNQLDDDRIMNLEIEMNRQAMEYETRLEQQQAEIKNNRSDTKKKMTALQQKLSNAEADMVRREQELQSALEKVAHWKRLHHECENSARTRGKQLGASENRVAELEEMLNECRRECQRERQNRLEKEKIIQANKSFVEEARKEAEIVKAKQIQMDEQISRSEAQNDELKRAAREVRDDNERLNKELVILRKRILADQDMLVQLARDIQAAGTGRVRRARPAVSKEILEDIIAGRNTTKDEMWSERRPWGGAVAAVDSPDYTGAWSIIEKSANYDTKCVGTDIEIPPIAPGDETELDWIRDPTLTAINHLRDSDTLLRQELDFVEEVEHPPQRAYATTSKEGATQTSPKQARSGGFQTSPQPYPHGKLRGGGGVQAGVQTTPESPEARPTATSTDGGVQTSPETPIAATFTEQAGVQTSPEAPAATSTEQAGVQTSPQARNTAESTDGGMQTSPEPNPPGQLRGGGRTRPSTTFSERPPIYKAGLSVNNSDDDFQTDQALVPTKRRKSAPAYPKIEPGPYAGRTGRRIPPLGSKRTPSPVVLGATVDAQGNVLVQPDPSDPAPHPLMPYPNNRYEEHIVCDLATRIQLEQLVAKDQLSAADAVWLDHFVSTQSTNPERFILAALYRLATRAHEAARTAATLALARQTATHASWLARLAPRIDSPLGILHYPLRTFWDMMNGVSAAEVEASAAAALEWTQYQQDVKRINARRTAATRAAVALPIATDPNDPAAREIVARAALVQRARGRHPVFNAAADGPSVAAAAAAAHGMSTGSDADADATATPAPGRPRAPSSAAPASAAPAPSGYSFLPALLRRRLLLAGPRASSAWSIVSAFLIPILVLLSVWVFWMHTELKAQQYAWRVVNEVPVVPGGGCYVTCDGDGAGWRWRAFVAEWVWSVWGDGGDRWGAV